MNLPKVSVVTICFNEKSTISSTVDSVVEQSYRNIEYIVIDGGSSDGTTDYLNNNAHKFSQYISEPDKGIFDAMNKALLMATGDWVIFMNAGDQFYDDNVLSKIFMKDLDQDVSLIYGNVCLYSHDDLYYFKSKTNKTKINLNAVCHQAVLIKRSIHPKFDLSYRLSADHHLIYQIIKTKVCLYVDIVVAKVLIGGVSSNLSATRKEKLRISLENGDSKDKALAYIFYTYGAIKQFVKFSLVRFFPESAFVALRKIKNNLEQK